MTTDCILLHNAKSVVTMDTQRREIADGAVLIQAGRIAAVGSTQELLEWIAHDPGYFPVQRIDLHGCVVTPGFINCHHHLYQTLTRSIGTSEGLSLFEWLKMLYRIWGGITPEALFVSTQTGIAELIRSGATTVTDHLYLYPNGCRLDDTIEAARELGVRFVASHGSMSLGVSAGGLPPDDLVDREPDILDESQRLIDLWHDPNPGAMIRIALAPCSPFSVSADLMRESARLARSNQNVRLHTHLAETLDENRYCLDRHGLRPLAYAESLEWLGEDVWFAHMVHPDASEIERMAASGTGVCHCPSSNMILASGIAPIRAMLDAGVHIGLGVDGSASNDGNHLLGEARQAMLLQRVGWPGFESAAHRMSARAALELATLGGARLLGRSDEIGSLEPGKAADIVAFRIDDLEHAGALGDPIAALLTCTPTHAWLSIIDGKIVLRDGILCSVDIDQLIDQHNEHSSALLVRTGLA